jgi:hypothetical protein
VNGINAAHSGASVSSRDLSTIQTVEPENILNFKKFHGAIILTGHIRSRLLAPRSNMMHYPRVMLCRQTPHDIVGIGPVLNGRTAGIDPGLCN